MKRIIALCSVLIVLTTVVCIALSSCNQKTEEFKKVPVVSTTAPVTEPVTYVYSDLSVFGTRMGMSLDETQKALDVPIAIRSNVEGTLFFTTEKTGLDFVSEGLEASVYFIFDTDVRLCEIQYASNNDTGFVLDEAIEKFDSLYGRHVAVDDKAEEKTNYIWFKDGDYIIVTVFDEGQNAISYFSKAYFESNKPEDAKAYNDAQ